MPSRIIQPSPKHITQSAIAPTNICGLNTSSRTNKRLPALIIVALFRCVLIFHSPDGSELVVQSDVVKVIRPIDARHREHVAPGTNSVLYLGMPKGFGVVETAAQALKMVKDCEPAARGAGS